MKRLLSLISYIAAAILLVLHYATNAFPAQLGPLPTQTQPGVLNKAGQSVQQQAAPLRLNQNVNLQQALAMPDATMIQSEDGKQSITVGELKRRLQAQQQLDASLSSPAVSLKGGKASITSPRGQTAVNNLTKMVAHETELAKAMLSKSATQAEPSTFAQPGIHLVNGKSRDFIVAPSTWITIGGREFGAAQGQVDVLGSYLYSGRIALRIISWHADHIVAEFPSGVRGVPDHDVSIQLVTSDRKFFQFPGGKFYATREEVEITDNNVYRMIQFELAKQWDAVKANDGYIYRETHGRSIDCAAPGFDRLTATDPGRGFVITAVHAVWGKTDSGDGTGDATHEGSGSRVFAGWYGFGPWDGDNIDVHWGVWRLHRSAYWGSQPEDKCLSTYKISVVLSGPADVSPF